MSRPACVPSSSRRTRVPLAEPFHTPPREDLLDLAPLTTTPTATGTGEVGERMHSLPKVAATTTLEALEWNVTALNGTRSQRWRR
jgi:hypothetical protein